jgi:hypothetical protein
MFFFPFDIMAVTGIVHEKGGGKNSTHASLKKIRSLIFDLEGWYTSLFVVILTRSRKVL